MYQHYVTETRVAQHQQQLMDEATVARQVRASRRSGQATGQAGKAGTALVFATWLRSLRGLRVGALAPTESANPR